MSKHRRGVSPLPSDYKGSSSNLAQILSTIGKGIKCRITELTPRQRVLAEFIIQNPESVGFLSITNLAKNAGVSESTVVRFCKALGYEGYVDLSKEVQQRIQFELSTVDRFKLLHKFSQSVTVGSLSAFERVVAHELENIAKLNESIKKSDFYNCINLMAKADYVYVVGCMGSASLAHYFGYMLSKILPRVVIVDSPGGFQSNMMGGLDPRCLVFLFAFPRYPRATVEIGEWAVQKGAMVIAITDSHTSPVVPLAHISFLISVGITSFVDAYAAPITFLNTLVTEFSERDSGATEHSLRQFEVYAEKEGLFLKSADRLAPSPRKDRGGKKSEDHRN
jgi:DNA-binding MurR/RpiR family transcriptional regulator